MIILLYNTITYSNQNKVFFINQNSLCRTSLQIFLLYGSSQQKALAKKYIDRLVRNLSDLNTINGK